MRKLFLSVAALFVSTAYAAPVADSQVWVMASVLAPIKDQYRFYLEVQPRIAEDVSRLRPLLVRPALVYRLSERNSVWFGYGYIPTFQGARLAEHRVWQQFFREVNDGWRTWIHRLRFEERFLQSADVSLRFRYMFRFLNALEDGKRWSVAAWDELMFNFNSVPGGPATGFDQNRVFVGISVLLAPVRIEPGYMNNLVRQPGPRDRINHVAYVMVAVTF